MSSPAKVEKKPTSPLTYFVGLVAIVAIVLFTWRELYKGVDAEKAAALAAQKEAEAQIKNGTYEFAKKWGPPRPGGSAPAGEEASSPSNEDVSVNHTNAVEAAAEPSAADASSKEPTSPEDKSSEKKVD